MCCACCSPGLGWCWAQSECSAKVCWQMNTHSSFYVYLSLVATVTNHHKFRDLKQHKYIILYSGGGKADKGLTGLKSTCQQGLVPSGGIPNHLSLTLPGSGSPLHSLAHGLLPAITLTQTLPCPFFTYRDLCNYLGSTRVVQDNLPISISLT